MPTVPGMPCQGEDRKFLLLIVVYQQIYARNSEELADRTPIIKYIRPLNVLVMQLHFFCNQHSRVRFFEIIQTGLDLVQVSFE